MDKHSILFVILFVITGIFLLVLVSLVYFLFTGQNEEAKSVLSPFVVLLFFIVWTMMDRFWREEMINDILDRNCLVWCVPGMLRRRVLYGSLPETEEGAELVDQPREWADPRQVKVSSHGRELSCPPV